MLSKIVKSNKSGFSLLEVMVAMFVFTVVMLATVAFFGTTVASYRNARAIQQDLENAQYAMNLMAKTIRTSSIGTCNIPNSSKLCVYDYSQSQCIIYKLSSSSLQKGSGSPTTPDDVSTCPFSTIESGGMNNMTGDVFINNLTFAPILSSSTVVGKVTISMEICPPNSDNTACSTREQDRVKIQSSVSLRDYNISGI